MMTSLPDYDDLLARLWSYQWSYRTSSKSLFLWNCLAICSARSPLPHTHTHQWAAVFLWNCLQQFAVISIMSIIALYCNKHQIMSRNCCMCMWLPCLGGRELKESAPRAVEGAARGTWTSAAIPLVSRPAGYTWTTACLVQYQKSFLHDAHVE